MNREETKKIIMAMSVYYPNFKPTEVTLMVDLWTDALADRSYQEVYTALKSYVMSDTSGFAPSIGAINNMINTLEERGSGEELTEMEAWAMVKTAIRDSLYHSEEHFKRFPPIVQKSVGSPSMLRQWAECDTAEVNTVIMSNFQRTYRSLVSRQKETRRLPSEVKQMLEAKLNNPLLIEKGDYE